MAFPNFLVFLLAGLSFFGDKAAPAGCSSVFLRPFTALCDLGIGWGVAILTAVGGTAVASLILVLLLTCRLSGVVEGEKRSRVTALLLMLTSIFGLCGLSLLHLIEGDRYTCIAQYILLAVLFFSCLACLLTQGMRLIQLPERSHSCSIRALWVLTVVLAVGQIFAAIQWVAVMMVNQGQLTCRSQPLDMIRPLMFVVVLLCAALSGVAWSRCRKQRHWKCAAVLLFATWLMSVLLWTTRIAFYVHANAALGLSSKWDSFEHAMVLLVQAWLLLVLYAIPEAHICLNLPPEPTLLERISTLWAPTQLNLDSFSEDTSLSSWQSGETEDSGFDGSSARCSIFRPGPRAPLSSNTDQSIRITIIDEEAGSA
ncbi:G-protein coupled receptor family C group 5 member B-like [Brienomyrus brachyistius]|uniref:G-protein coupled receptor family C group 5 member B-like n=1 Tax=Brienomyrus brachyistius TaxID=42636 RepID=UPI0020B194BF|nr:G-protein coupled receptor family C group 5 member B-like [Brienomyrus brachyistius]